MLSIDKRPCHIGNSFSSNTEHHGAEDVGAIDLPLDGIMLNAVDLEALLGPGAHKALYLYPDPNGEDSPLPEVRFPMLHPLKLKQEFEKATVAVTLGYDEQLTMTWQGCKIRGIVLTTQAGGLTKMKCSIRARPDPSDVAELFQDLNGDGSIEISEARKAQPKKAKDKQTDLPLGEHPDPDATNDEDEREPETAEA